MSSLNKKKKSDRLERNKSNQTCMNDKDRICFNEKCDKKTLKTVNLSASSTSLETFSVQSGESAFKIFIFESNNNEEMKKCMTFWKDILKKSIKPTKCVRKTKEKQKFNGEKCTKKEEIMWLDIYKELQRRNLDKIKLQHKTKHSFHYENVDETDENIKIETNKQEIKDLNDWKPTNRTNNIVTKDPRNKIKEKTSEKKTIRKDTENKIQENRESKTKIIKKNIQEEMSREEKTKTKDKMTENNVQQEVYKEENNIQKEMPEEETIDNVTENNIQQKAYEEQKHEKTENVLESISGEEKNTDRKINKTTENKTETKIIEEKNSSCTSCFCSTDCECNFPKSVICACGCFLKNCICEEDFLSVCKCETDFSSNCFELESNLSSSKKPLEAISQNDINNPKTMTVIDKKVQTECDLSIVALEEMVYCIICGHYNCFCNK